MGKCSMTLILSLATPEFVVQVSDRRLTTLRPGTTQFDIVDDNRNKIVDWGNRVVFGYTGLAQINGISTDDWLARSLASIGNTDLNLVLKHVRDRATQDFA